MENLIQVLMQCKKYSFFRSVQSISKQTPITPRNLQSCDMNSDIIKKGAPALSSDFLGETDRYSRPTQITPHNLSSL